MLKMLSDTAFLKQMLKCLMTRLDSSSTRRCWLCRAPQI